MKFKIIISIVVAINIALVLFFESSTVNVGYVNTLEIIEEYKGMEEGRALYEVEFKKVQFHVDSLKNSLEGKMLVYNKIVETLSEADKVEKQVMLEQERDYYIKSVKFLEEQLQNKDKTLTEGVIKQINTFIEEYGKKHNYTLILSTTGDGTLLYGKDGINITDIVLDGLNQEYSGIH